MLRLWGQQAAAFIQALQLMYGLGSLMAPLLAKPFLADGHRVRPLLRTPEGNISKSHSIASEPIHEYDSEPTRLAYPYGILAGFMAVNAVCLFLLWLLCPTTSHQRPAVSRSASEDGQETCDEPQGNKELKCISTCAHGLSLEDSASQVSQDEDWRRWLWPAACIALVALFMHVLLGLQVSFGAFLLTFAVHCNLRLSKESGAVMTTVYWAAFTAAKLASLPLLLGHEVSIGISLATMMVGSVPLIACGSSKASCLWSGVVLEGLGVSALFACVFGYVQLHLPVNERLASFVAVASVLGELTYPLLISHFIEREPESLMIVLLASVCLMSLLFLSIRVICRYKLGACSTLPLK